MNILIPDSWLREFLKTKATPKQLKDCLSLSGPSVERMSHVGKEIVYDIEVTGNRPDMMSVTGIARDASVILPRYGIKAEYIHDPYTIKRSPILKKTKYKLSIRADKKINPRFTAIVIDHVENQPSPSWMQSALTLSGMRPINAIVDITNFLMKAYGQPVHAFDYDEILTDDSGIPAMILRESIKGETITTLDGKLHTLPGGDIVIEDGSNRLIDLCGIMGGGVSHIKDDSKRIVLFVQTYDPLRIRKTSMALSHRTDASGLFEKGLDPELVMPTFLWGIELIKDLTGGTPASPIYDIYPDPYVSYSVSVTREKVDFYLGTKLSPKELESILAPLGFSPKITDDTITVSVPSYRRDIQIDVDIIEEIARIYGYHKITTKLPDTEPPLAFPDPMFKEESTIKHMLKDWGYTETYTYSMVSEELMDIFELSKKEAYVISNPLSSEWIYMRPSLLPSLLPVIAQNLSFKKNLKMFELSMTYEFRKDNLPYERPTLIVIQTGQSFFELKGIAEQLFDRYGIAIQHSNGKIPRSYQKDSSLLLGEYGIVGEINIEILSKFDIKTPVTVLELDVEKLYCRRQKNKTYIPIPKYPESYEDIALVLPPKTHVGPILDELKNCDENIKNVTLLDSYEDTRTFHITLQSKTKNLEAGDIRTVREKILKLAAKKYHASLKSVS